MVQRSGAEHDKQFKTSCSWTWFARLGREIGGGREAREMTGGTPSREARAMGSRSKGRRAQGQQEGGAMQVGDGGGSGGRKEATGRHGHSVKANWETKGLGTWEWETLAKT
ncbi:hypothetical protein L7F22_001827 [Adiantum nelumboides]|nr:hypothetical protein [Adiantum nelumboides]